jgi:hypothetical protein
MLRRFGGGGSQLIGPKDRRRRPLLLGRDRHAVENPSFSLGDFATNIIASTQAAFDEDSSTPPDIYRQQGILEGLRRNGGVEETSTNLGSPGNGESVKDCAVMAAKRKNVKATGCRGYEFRSKCPAFFPL